MALDPGIWYVRDDSPINANTGLTAATGGVGTVGWSAVTAWAASASIASGSIRRQSGGTFSGTGSRSGSTLTIATVVSGSIYLGQSLFTAAGVSLGTVTALGTGTGGTGTYTTSGSGTVSAGTTINGGFVQGNQLCFIATQSGTGTTGATEPNWSNGQARGATITDNTVTWIECTGAPGVNGDITNTPLSSSVRSSSPGRGSIIKNNAGTHLFIQTSAAGTTGSGEPSYNTAAVGNTTTDNTVTWTYIGTSFGNWAAPLSTITQGSTWLVAGDSVYVGDDHNENYGAAVTIQNTTSQAGPLFFLSIDHTASHPPTGVSAGATVTAATGVTVTMNDAYFYGFTFNSGVGASTNVGVNLTPADLMKFDTCTFKLSSTSTTSLVNLGSANNAFLEFYSCTCVFQNTSQKIEINCGRVLWRGGSILTGGATPTTLFAAAGQGIGLFEGVDLSAISGTLVPANTIAGDVVSFVFTDCKLNASVTMSATPGTRAVGNDLVRCGSDSKTYIQRRYTYQGTLQEESTIIRTGGASDGTTGISWNIATTANAKWQFPFEAFPTVIWNPTTGSNVVLTLCGIWNAAAVPNNDDIWLDVEFLGETTPTPLGKYKLGSKSNALASNAALTADSVSAWDSLATARANSHAYSLGDAIAVSSNSGRLFFCTTAGTSSGSLPAGYASAVDGGSVTDGTAVFRAGCRFKLTVTMSSPQPQLAGYLQAIVRAAKVSSTFYVDPQIALS